MVSAQYSMWPLYVYTITCIYMHSLGILHYTNAFSNHMVVIVVVVLMVFNDEVREWLVRHTIILL